MSHDWLTLRGLYWGDSIYSPLPLVTSCCGTMTAVSPSEGKSGVLDSSMID